MKNIEHEYTRRYIMKEYKWNNLSMFYLARGILISFMVVYGVFFDRFCHEPWFYLPGRVITTCFVPMVFVMSGYHISKQKIFKRLWKCCHKYLRPYVLAALGASLLMYIRIMRWAGDGSSELRKVMWGYLYGTSCRTLVGSEETYAVQELWILLALFIGLLIMNILIRFPVLLQYAGGISLVAVGYYLPYAGVDVYCVPQALVACGFLLVGYRLRESRWFEQGAKRWKLILLGVVGFAGVVIGRMDIEYQTYRYPAIVIPCACCAAIFLLYACISIGWRWQNYLIVKILKSIGHYSLWITIMFHVVNRCLPMRKLLRGIGVDDNIMGVLSLLYTVLYLVVGCAVLNYLKRIRIGVHKQHEVKRTGREL